MPLASRAPRAEVLTPTASTMAATMRTPAGRWARGEGQPTTRRERERRREPRRGRDGRERRVAASGRARTAIVGKMNRGDERASNDDGQRDEGPDEHRKCVDHGHHPKYVQITIRK